MGPFGLFVIKFITLELKLNFDKNMRSQLWAKYKNTLDIKEIIDKRYVF